MAKTQAQPDVLVLGDHPAGYLAATLLSLGGAGRIVHAPIPGERADDRLVLINPEFFGLHKSLSGLKKRLSLAPVYGITFLADKPETEIAAAGNAVAGFIGNFKEIHAALVELAEASGVDLLKAKSIQINELDETGAALSLGAAQVRPKMLIVAGELPADAKKSLGLAERWDVGVVHRYSYLKLKGTKWVQESAKPVMPMSLDLNGTLNWAWLLIGPDAVQLAIEQPLQDASHQPPAKMMRHWAGVLQSHGALQSDPGDIDFGKCVSIDLPLAGALTQESVANRTLLIGPAGGFYNACAEDIYPNCWSAVHAAEVATTALKERHMQDALQPYRQLWGATLGDYLRGPQQNLKFLLPLVYRNEMMAGRLADAIFSGKSVVR